MNMHCQAFENELEELIQFMTSSSWVFHGTANPDPLKIRAAFESGAYTGEGIQTFWIVTEQMEKVGLIRLYDLQDPIPLFDIRILETYRGQGIGAIAVGWLVAYVFNQYADKVKLEAYTRKDNHAMRTVFHKCGFLKEAYHRQSWQDQNGLLHDSVGYGITRDDWTSGIATPIDWNDFKY